MALKISDATGDRTWTLETDLVLLAVPPSEGDEGLTVEPDWIQVALAAGERTPSVAEMARIFKLAFFEQLDKEGADEAEWEQDWSIRAYHRALEVLGATRDAALERMRYHATRHLLPHAPPGLVVDVRIAGGTATVQLRDGPAVNPSD